MKKALITGVHYSVRDFVNIVAKELEINIQWKGAGIEEIGIDTSTGNTIVSVDARYFRPTEVETLLGDATKAKEKLGWEPKISFDEMVKEMTAADLKEAEKERLYQNNGFDTFHRYE